MRILICIICCTLILSCSYSEFDRINEKGQRRNDEIIEELNDLNGKLEYLKNASSDSLLEKVFETDSNNVSWFNKIKDDSLNSLGVSGNSILTPKERQNVKTYNTLNDPELIKLFSTFEIENMNYPGMVIEALIDKVGYTEGVVGKLKEDNPKVDYLIMPSYYNNIGEFALNCVAVNEQYEYIASFLFYENYTYENESYKTFVAEKDKTTYILTTEVEQKLETYELKFLENGYFKRVEVNK